MEYSTLTSTFINIIDKLRGFVMGITGNKDETDDILQDAFIKLWKNHKEIRSEIEASKLAYTVVRNTAIDSLRQNIKHKYVPIDQIPEVYTTANSKNELTDDVALCNSLIILSKRILNDKQYKVFLMHDIDGLTYLEIANELGITQENVRMILCRARKMMREEYRKQNY